MDGVEDFTLDEARFVMVVSILPWMRPSWGWCSVFLPWMRLNWGWCSVFLAWMRPLWMVLNILPWMRPGVQYFYLG